MKETNFAFGGLLNLGVTLPVAVTFVTPIIAEAIAPLASEEIVVPVCEALKDFGQAVKTGVQIYKNMSYLQRGVLSLTSNVAGQYAVNQDVDYVDAGSAFVFNIPDGLNLGLYSVFAAFGDYTWNNGNFQTPLGDGENYKPIEKAVWETTSNFYFGWMGIKISTPVGSIYGKWAISTGANAASNGVPQAKDYNH